MRANFPDEPFNPVVPAIATLRVDIEAHDATVVHERLNQMMADLRAEYGDNVGAISVTVEYP